MADRSRVAGPGGAFDIVRSDSAPIPFRETVEGCNVLSSRWPGFGAVRPCGAEPTGVSDPHVIVVPIRCRRVVGLPHPPPAARPRQHGRGCAACGEETNMSTASTAGAPSPTSGSRRPPSAALASEPVTGSSTPGRSTTTPTGANQPSAHSGGIRRPVGTPNPSTIVPTSAGVRSGHDRGKASKVPCGWGWGTRGRGTTEGLDCRPEGHTCPAWSSLRDSVSRQSEAPVSAAGEPSGQALDRALPEAVRGRQKASKARQGLRVVIDAPRAPRQSQACRAPEDLTTYSPQPPARTR